MARTLSEVKDVLRSHETTALADVATTLAEVAESLARTARELHEMSREEWMDAEEAAAYLRRTPKAFEKVIAKGEIPKHYLRGSLANRSWARKSALQSAGAGLSDSIWWPFAVQLWF
jgi:hypothetical protein